MEWPKKDERLYTNTTACFCSRPRISYGYPILRTLFFFISISYVLKLGLGANEWLSFPFRLFKKTDFFSRATCTTTNAHGEETPRHGAFFHLEIPSVIISGASQASGGGGTRREEEKPKATARWRGCLFFT
ncbi:hypothetical protein J3F84DRAFT_278200 [Trichoderma pleuroticola]